MCDKTLSVAALRERQTVIHDRRLVQQYTDHGPVIINNINVFPVRVDRLSLALPCDLIESLTGHQIRNIAFSAQQQNCAINDTRDLWENHLVLAR